MPATPLISTQRLDSSPWRKGNIRALVEDLYPVWQESTSKAKKMEAWYRNEVVDARELAVLPASAPEDVKALREISSTSWAKMICDSQSQDLVVDGLRQRETGNTAPAMELWDRNSLGSRQKPVHDGAIRHGKSFNFIGQAVGRLDGARTAFIRGKSALTSDAIFRDDFDEYPEFFLEIVEERHTEGMKWRITLADEANIHTLVSNPNMAELEYLEPTPHGMGICPVVRFAHNLDLTGRAQGEIEPYITLFKRINQSTMDRLTVQRYGAHLVRWLAGLEKPKTDDEARAAAIALGVTDLLILENPQAKAGALPATQLQPYIASRESDIRDLAAVSQTPSFQMLGLSDNVGAEGLAAAMDSHYLKGNLTRIAFGESWEASMRLAGWAAGQQEIAEDFQSRVDWRETRSQAFQSLVQGLSQMATDLGIAPELIWHRIPGWTDADTTNAKRLQQQQEAKDAQLAEEDFQRQKELQDAKRPAPGV